MAGSSVNIAFDQERILFDMALQNDIWLASDDQCLSFVFFVVSVEIWSVGSE